MIALALASGCMPAVKNASGQAVAYEDPESPGRLAGVGLESQDLISSTDKMARDMLATPALGSASPPPRVIIDAEYMSNESSSRINVNAITDRLRVELNRAAKGRLTFVGREYAPAVDTERAAKRAGTINQGALGLSGKRSGADYRLGGRVTSLDQARSDGFAARYHLLTFEMVDLETAEIVWSGTYEFKKSAQDDVVYR